MRNLVDEKHLYNSYLIEENKKLLDIIIRIFEDLDGRFDYALIDDEMYERIKSVIDKSKNR